MTPQPTSIDEVAKKILITVGADAALKDPLWTLNSQDWIISLITTLVEQAKREGRDMAFTETVEYIEQNALLRRLKDGSNLPWICAVDVKSFMLAARTISSDK